MKTQKDLSAYRAIGADMRSTSWRKHKVVRRGKDDEREAPKKNWHRILLQFDVLLQLYIVSSMHRALGAQQSWSRTSW